MDFWDDTLDSFAVQTIRIDPRRLGRDLEALAAIGATGDGGVHRPALGEAHLEARRWWRERIAADGVELRVDGAGNHGAILRSRNPSARTLLLGSHLDSVPHGGRFDGALGVVAAYEALRAVRDAGLDLPVHLEAIDFTDEEGAWVCLLGSRALAGALTSEELERPRGDHATLERALRGAGLTPEGILGARRNPATLAGFLELHIEQGPRLLEAGAAIGVVSSIAGIASYELRYRGRADHAGTTPLGARRDAGRGAASLIVAASEIVEREFEGCVVNFGRLALEPGAFNVVPTTAELAVELRAPDDERLDELEVRVLDLARERARRYELGLDIRPRGRIASTPCAPTIRQAFEEACDVLRLRCVPLVSGAGHDTGALARVCPAGLAFIPSSGGSHSPHEHAEPVACVDGANALLLAALRFVERLGA